MKLCAKCNQRLFFDTASLFVRVGDIGIPIIFKGATEVYQEKVNTIIAAYDVLESFLATDSFLVGSNLTIADVCVSLFIPLFVPIRAEKYPKIMAWLNRVQKTIPFFE